MRHGHSHPSAPARGPGLDDTAGNGAHGVMCITRTGDLSPATHPSKAYQPGDPVLPEELVRYLDGRTKPGTTPSSEPRALRRERWLATDDPRADADRDDTLPTPQAVMCGIPPQTPASPSGRPTCS